MNETLNCLKIEKNTWKKVKEIGTFFTFHKIVQFTCFPILVSVVSSLGVSPGLSGALNKPALWPIINPSSK
jgi:hypothetical protein